jgi:LD-carboxypeptidase N-terminal domain
MTRMTRDLVHPPKARSGERIAVLSPSFAAAGAFPAVHEQAMRRLAEVTGLVPVEYPTTRKVGATALERAADINAAFADPAIRGILAVIGREDQITVIPHLDAALARADPKPFLGTSDNTNLHHWLWANGIASFYGGSSQVHLGPGPRVDDVHARSLLAALITGETLEITDPGESEDVGVDWGDPRALECFGEREPVEPWSLRRLCPHRAFTCWAPLPLTCGQAWGQAGEWLPTVRCMGALASSFAGRAAILSPLREPLSGATVQTLLGTPRHFRQSFSSSKQMNDSVSWVDSALFFALQARGRWFDPSCAHPEIPGQSTTAGLTDRDLKIV